MEEAASFFIVSKQGNEIIRVPEGETVIGRGIFLKIKDPKVSRSHAIISLQNGILKIKPTSSNPTFIWDDKNRRSKLQKDVWKTLNNGIKISLLPDDLIFSVDKKPTPTDNEKSYDFEGIKHAIPRDKETYNNKAYCREEEGRKFEKHMDSRGQEIQDQHLNDLITPEELSSKQPTSDEIKIIPCSESLVSNDRHHEATFDDSIESENESHKIKPATETETQYEKSKQDEESIPIKTEIATTSSVDSPRKIIEAKKKERVLPKWMTTASTMKSPSKRNGKKAKDGSANAGNASKELSESKSNVQASPLIMPKKNDNTEKDESSKSATRKRPVSEEDGKEGEHVNTRRPKVFVSNLKDTRSNQKQEDDLKDDELSNAASSAIGDAFCALDEEIEKGAENDTTTKTSSADVLLMARGESSKDKKLKNDTLQDQRSKTGSLQHLQEQALQAKTASSSNTIGDVSKKKQPRCQYGKSCYRKNPAHFQEYSHSDNDDKEDGESNKDAKPECPFGTSCYRRNPQHKKEYKHTKPPSSCQTATRKSNRKTKNAKKSEIAGDEDEDGDYNDYDYDDSFIDDETNYDESESSSYDNDDADEDWSPAEEL